MFGKPPVIYQDFPLPKIDAIRYFIQTGKSALIRCFVESPGYVFYIILHILHLSFTKLTLSF